MSNPAFSEESPDWQLHEEKRGVLLYLRDYPNSPIPEFKAETQIKSSVASVLGVLLHTEACPEWFHQCERATILEAINPHETIVYQVNKIPFARDRDILFRAKLNFKENGDTILIDISSAEGYCLNNDNEVCADINASKHIRVTQVQGQYRLQKLDDENTKVTWQQYLDPAGSLPSWVIRSQLDNLAFNSLKGLREQATKKDYQSLRLRIENGLLSVIPATPAAVETPQ